MLPKTHRSSIILASVTVADRTAPIAPPRPLTTTKHSYTDPRGHLWTYEADVLAPEPPLPTSPTASPVVFLHASGGLGVNRTYWDRLLSVLSTCPDALCRHPVARFDWVGTATTEPKPPFVKEPYDAAFFAAQLAHFASTFGQKIIVVSQGASEPIVIRFAVDYPHLIKAYIIATGLGTRYLTTDPKVKLRNASYAFFTSLAGDAFWQVVRTRRYITAFSQKNLLSDDTWLEEWVSRALAGSRDRRIRFNVYSFIAGFLFGNYTEDLKKIDIPTMYLAGTTSGARTVGNRAKSLRPPAPLLATESSFRDKAVERMKHRCAIMPNCKGVVVEGAGFEMFFEQTELALPPLERFLRSLEE